MSNINERLDNLKLEIQKPEFLEGKGLSNEVNIRIFCYEPENEMVVRHFVNQMETDQSLDCRLMVCNSNFQTCRAACPPYVVPAFRHKQCMNPASLQFRLSLSRAILSMRISVHYRARRGEWRKTILSRKLICAVILFKHKQLRPRVRTLII